MHACVSKEFGLEVKYNVKVPLELGNQLKYAVSRKLEKQSQRELFG